VWYRLNDQPETNDNELKLAAIMGTAIHAEIEKALADNKDVLIETEVEYNGMKAHVDCFVPGTGDVIDWKTSKVRNLSYFPSLQQRWQVKRHQHLRRMQVTVSITASSMTQVGRWDALV
jgi:hypothetical protein